MYSAIHYNLTELHILLLVTMYLRFFFVLNKKNSLYQVNIKFMSGRLLKDKVELFVWILLDAYINICIEIR